ncbi:MAG: hypothetical protein ACHQXA_02430 [Gemmatimonadales bacterium]
MKIPEVDQLHPLAASTTPPADFPAEQPFAPNVAGEFGSAPTGSICIWSLAVSAAEREEHRTRAGKAKAGFRAEAVASAGMADLAAAGMDLFAGFRAAPEVQQRLAALVDQLALDAAAKGWTPQTVTPPGLPPGMAPDRRSFRASDRYLEIWGMTAGADPAIIVIAGPEGL